MFDICTATLAGLRTKIKQCRDIVGNFFIQMQSDDGLSSSGTRVTGGSGSCVTDRRGFQAALMREGRPPALANAPCSRDRSCRIGCTLSTYPPAVISTVSPTTATWTWRPRLAVPAL